MPQVFRRFAPHPFEQSCVYHHFPPNTQCYDLAAKLLDEMMQYFQQRVWIQRVLRKLQDGNSSDIFFDQEQDIFPLFLEFWSKSIRG
jgi:hypothetical protein